MKNSVYVVLPLMLIGSVPAFVALWCLWTGVREGFLRLALASLVLLLGFGASALAFWPGGTMSVLHMLPWGIGGMWVLLLAFAMPMMRRAVAALPEAPVSASLKPRRLELFRGAFVWPFVVWALLFVLLATSGELSWITAVGPAVGLASLIFLPFALKLAVQEPEPLGGDDPGGLAERYAAFRARRVQIMYWMFVVLALCVSGAWRLLPAHAGWNGGIFGTVLGFMGATFGTWADAQRYLLRRQLSGVEPPA